MDERMADNGLDYSPDATHGEFFRAVVNGQTTKETVDRLVATIQEAGTD